MRLSQNACQLNRSQGAGKCIARKRVSIWHTRQRCERIASLRCIGLLAASWSGVCRSELRHPLAHPRREIRARHMSDSIKVAPVLCIVKGCQAWHAC